MLPTQYPYHHPTTLTHWRHFREQPTAPKPPPTSLDPLVYESWQRCDTLFTGGWAGRAHHYSASPSPADIDLMAITQPYLEDIYQFAPTSAQVVFVTNREGRLLAMAGDPTTRHALQRVGIGIGDTLAEAQSGTNAVALALHTAMPMQVVGAEHYLQLYHEYVTTAAPIHNEAGHLIGAIGMMGNVEQANASYLALMMTTARAISTQLQSDLVLEQANERLRQLDTILESVTDGVLTWDETGVIDHINATACHLLGVKRGAVLGQPVAAFFALTPHLQQAIAEQQELSDVETSLQIGERIIKCMLTIRPIHQPAQGGLAMVRGLSQVRSLVNQQTSAPARLTFEDFQSESVVMRQAMRQAQIAARASAPVLLVGEVGVGKSALAQAIHNAGPRAGKPFIVVNCRAIPNEALRSELLGVESHRAGEGRPSKFELADGGTILLDEIDHLSLEAQSILEQMLSSRTLLRLNATRATTFNVRVVATTTADLEVLVESRRFLSQLYYRFGIFTLSLPPLRERQSDIPLLVQRYLRADAPAPDLDPTVLEVLAGYPWPGNVRELESVVEQLRLNAEGRRIRVTDVPEPIRTGRSLRPGTLIPRVVLSLDVAEREAILQAGWAHRGALSAMADALGIDRTTLWRKLKRYGIRAEDFR